MREKRGKVVPQGMCRGKQYRNRVRKKGIDRKRRHTQGKRETRKQTRQSTEEKNKGKNAFTSTPKTNMQLTKGWLNPDLNQEVVFLVLFR